MESFFQASCWNFFWNKKIVIEGRTKTKTQIKIDTCTLQDLCLHCFAAFIQARNRKMAISFKNPTQSIYPLNYLTHRCFKVTNCSLTESKMVTFSLTKSKHRARSGGVGGGGVGGLYCAGRRSRLRVYESVGMSYERVEKSVISVLTP